MSNETKTVGIGSTVLMVTRLTSNSYEVKKPQGEKTVQIRRAADFIDAARKAFPKL